MSDIQPRLTEARSRPQGAAMLTGKQIASARVLAGIRSQAKLAQLVGVGRATIERAEQAGNAYPSMGADTLASIVQAIEAAGVEFFLADGASLAGGIGFRLRSGAMPSERRRPKDPTTP